MLEKLILNDDLKYVLENNDNIIIPTTKEQLYDLMFVNGNSDEVGYDVNGNYIKEASVVRCKNGVSINYFEDYMRRRDPNCMVIGDDKPTDKPRFNELYNEDFAILRHQTFVWLRSQKLIVVPFMSGGAEYGFPSILIAPANAAFFANILAQLQCFVNLDEYVGEFKPQCVIYLAPIFRHTYFNGKQVVVHNRLDEMYEMFSFNLYPGPSAKKGVYGFLIDMGERQNFLTNHASTVKVITPYENEIVIMHEGASGGGKSEMLESVHLEEDGKILLGTNTITGEKLFVTLRELCQLNPVTDDMAICPASINDNNNRLVVTDGEDGWFLRVDNITGYGTEPMYERISIQPPKPLIFINIDGAADSTCLIWEHTLDTNGKPCPNPRVVMPRAMIPNCVKGSVEVDVRSFGVRTPPTTAANPSYGIMGMLHILPPALAWLWRLVSPRGYNNPSINDTSTMGSEGVGSYWPFATGKRVTQANLLLKQITNSPSTRHMIIPNQHIGCYAVGFMPQWIDREYIARRGTAKFRPELLAKARCTLLGYCLESLKIDGQYVPKALLQPETQSELGAKGYDRGATILVDFFKRELQQYLTEELDPLGRQIIECCLNDGSLEQYLEFIPIRY